MSNLNNRHTAHASEITYELHSLGWKAFQQLCLTIVGEIWGQSVQGFFDSRDGGRDGAFYGKWAPTKSEVYEGSFTVQCKFTTKPNQTIRLASLKDERKKAERLAETGLCDNYILFTNSNLTGENDEEIRTSFEQINNLNHCRVFGIERISQFIKESSRLRMLVPRVYGLGDLSTILDERAMAQSKEILSSLGDDLQKFVITDAYRRSTRAIVDHGMVMLLGEPACGKSAIATALSMGALDEWGCSTFKIRDAADLARHSNPHDAKQFFWVDDVFGATQLDYQSVLEWNRVLPHINAALKRGAKFVFTSRDYIYRNARSLLKESALPILVNAQVVIKVEDITPEERQQILYNHVRLGTQPQAFKSAVKPHLDAVASNVSFKPEIARRLGNPAFTARLTISAMGLQRFVEKPVEFLQEVIRTLDAPSRSAISLVFMRGGSMESPISLSPEEDDAMSMLGGQKAEVLSALSALDGSILIKVQEGGRSWWRFKHPSIRDAFADLVAENRELMDIYLKGTPLLQMLGEITCGDMKYEGVKVVVPPDRYQIVISRIQTLLAKGRDGRSSVISFLSRRCTSDFLAEFLNQNPAFLSTLNVGAYLYAVEDVSLIVTLSDAKLLPEPERLRHISRVREVVIDTPDAGFTKDGIKRLFTPEEYDALLSDLRSSLINDLDDCFWNWRTNEDPDSGEDNYSELESAMEGFKALFPDDEEVITQISVLLSRVEDRVAELASSRRSARRQDDITFSSKGPEAGNSLRSVFDDIDE